MSDANEKIEKRSVTVVLTEEERNERSLKSARLLGDLEEARTREKMAENAKRAVVKELPETASLDRVRSECEHLEAEARRCARIAREGKEERLVECEWREQGTVEVLVRLDTGEAIDSRELTPARRQGSLDFDETGPVN